MRLILQVLDLRRILEAARFGSEEHNRLEARKFSRIDQDGLVLAEDLVQRSHIGRQLWE